MKNSESFVFPPDADITYLREGLTKREYFAVKAMQGLLAQERNPHRLDLSRRALEYANTLIEELEKSTDGGSSGLGVVNNQNSGS